MQIQMAESIDPKHGFGVFLQVCRAGSMHNPETQLELKYSASKGVLDLFSMTWPTISQTYFCQ